jgi:hypothetical protein
MERNNYALHDPGAGCRYNDALHHSGMAAAILDAHQTHFCGFVAGLSLHMPKHHEPDAEGHLQMELNQIARVERSGNNISFCNRLPGCTQR